MAVELVELLAVPSDAVSSVDAVVVALIEFVSSAAGTSGLGSSATANSVVAKLLSIEGDSTSVERPYAMIVKNWPVGQLAFEGSAQP